MELSHTADYRTVEAKSGSASMDSAGITVVESDPAWPEVFEQIRQRLASVVGLLAEKRKEGPVGCEK
jgi:GrpB-like predicted nucleotidyltransferase (UPF0157 family)